MSPAITLPDPYATATDATTLTLQRHLPGTPERVWSWLTDSELRSRWLAAGVMQPDAGTEVDLVWRNDTLSAPDDPRPAGFNEEAHATCTITDWQPPRRLAFLWPGVGEVSFELQPEGDGVLLTLTHRRLASRAMKLMVGAGWHMHLDILAARVAGTPAPSFWRGWARLRDDYDRRLPA